MRGPGRSRYFLGRDSPKIEIPAGTNVMDDNNRARAEETREEVGSVPARYPARSDPCPSLIVGSASVGGPDRHDRGNGVNDDGTCMSVGAAAGTRDTMERGKSAGRSATCRRAGPAREERREIAAGPSLLPPTSPVDPVE